MATKSVVIDDHSFRGSASQVVAAVHTALTFDNFAGLQNNIKKFVAMSNSPDARDYLRTCKFNGSTIKVALEDKLIGTYVTVRRAPRRALQDARLASGISCALRIAPAGVDRELKQYATTAAAITKMTFGILWTLPSVKSIAQARTAVLRAEWGHARAMRCPEIVLGILRNPVRDDLLSAIIYRAICDLRRVTLRNQANYDRFHYNLDVGEATWRTL